MPEVWDHKNDAVNDTKSAVSSTDREFLFQEATVNKTIENNKKEQLNRSIHNRTIEPKRTI